jgi:predicted acyltransferase
MSCSLRVFNELPAALTITSGNTTLLTTAPSSSSSYLSVPCQASLVAAAPGYSSMPATLPASTSTSHFTVLALGTSPTAFTASVFADPDTGLTDSADSDNIDAATLTVVNGLSYSADIFGVASECYNCAMPLLSESLAPGDAVPLRLLAVYDHFSIRACPHKDGAKTVPSLPVVASCTPVQVLPMTTVQEHGVYTLLLHSNGSSSLLTDVPGRDAYLPLLYTFLTLAFLGVLHRLAGWGYVRLYKDSTPPAQARGARKGEVEVSLASFLGFSTLLQQSRAKQSPSDDGFAAQGLSSSLLGSVEGSLQLQDSEAVAPPAAQPAAAAAAKPERVLSLDTFRGFSLVLMMFANFGGGEFWFFDHARWNGLTCADLLFPWFVFMSGVSAALSFASERKRGASKVELVKKTLLRALKLLALGLLVVNNPVNLPNLRMFSVLSYFGFSYLVIGLLDALVPVLGAAPTALSTTYAASLWQDVGRYALHWAAMGVIAAVYLGLRFLLPVPGCPTGYTGPGGLADQGAYPASCVGGAAGYLDRWLFGVKHSYGQPTCTDLYQCGPYDPEGALGALMASWMAFLGLTAGRVLESQRSLALAGGHTGGNKFLAGRLTVRWVATGLLMCLAAGVLCGCEWRVACQGCSAHWQEAAAADTPLPHLAHPTSHPPTPSAPHAPSVKKEGGFIPVAKNMWSPSFILLLAGFGHLNLAFLFNVVDAQKLWSGSPFVYVGKNSLATYVVSELLSDNFPLKMHLWAKDGWVSHGDAMLSNTVGICSLLALARYWHLTGFSFSV